MTTILSHSRVSVAFIVIWVLRLKIDVKNSGNYCGTGS